MSKGWVFFRRSVQCSFFSGRPWARQIWIFVALALSRVSRPQQRHSHARCIFIRMCRHAFNHTSHKPIWPGYTLILSTPRFKIHCNAVPACARSLSSSNPPTRALSITASPHTSWCRIYCDHSSAPRNAPPTLHDMAGGSSSCGPRVSTHYIIF